MSIEQVGPTKGDKRRRAPSRTVILNVAADLFDRLGYRAVSMQQLADELGISKPTLYVHVDSKPAIVRAIVDQWIEACDPALDDALSQPTASAKIQHFLRAWTASALAYSAQNRFFEHAQREVPHEVERYQRWSSDVVHRVRSVIEEGQRSGEFRTDADPTVITFMLFSAVNWTARWYDPDKSLSPEEIADQYALVYGRGLFIGDSHRQPD